jgi:RNA polymerase sigma factor (sigma-70 family)
MSSEGSVTHWIGQLQAGDREAAQKLWERYFRRLVGLAHKKLRDAPRVAADSEDVALSAFASFCTGVDRGHLPQLADRDDLWRLLVTITARKALKTVRDQTRQKRGGGVRPEAALFSPDESSSAGPDLQQIVGREPTPAFAAQVAEECRRLLDKLEDAGLQTVARAKMEGYTNEEIAAQLDIALSTVERRLRRIRRVWQKETAA